MLSIKQVTLFTVTINVFNKAWHLDKFTIFLFCYNPDVSVGLQMCFLRSVRFLGHSWLNFASFIMETRRNFNVFHKIWATAGKIR